MKKIVKILYIAILISAGCTGHPNLNIKTKEQLKKWLELKNIPKSKIKAFMKEYIDGEFDLEGLVDEIDDEMNDNCTDNTIVKQLNLSQDQLASLKQALKNDYFDLIQNDDSGSKDKNNANIYTLKQVQLEESEGNENGIDKEQLLDFIGKLKHDILYWVLDTTFKDSFYFVNKSTLLSESYGKEFTQQNILKVVKNWFNDKSQNSIIKFDQENNFLSFFKHNMHSMGKSNSENPSPWDIITKFIKENKIEITKKKISDTQNKVKDKILIVNLFQYPCKLTFDQYEDKWPKNIDHDFIPKVIKLLLLNPFKIKINKKDLVEIINFILKSEKDTEISNLKICKNCQNNIVKNIDINCTIEACMLKSFESLDPMIYIYKKNDKLYCGIEVSCDKILNKKPIQIIFEISTGLEKENKLGKKILEIIKFACEIIPLDNFKSCNKIQKEIISYTDKHQRHNLLKYNLDIVAALKIPPSIKLTEKELFKFIYKDLKPKINFQTIKKELLLNLYFKPISNSIQKLKISWINELTNIIVGYLNPLQDLYQKKLPSYQIEEGQPFLKLYF